MSSLQLPPSVIDQLDRRRRAFLWSAEKTGKANPANCLVAWSNVCKPRDLGGLGIKDMGTQNICLLLKLIHKLHHPEFSAWAQWVQGRASIATLSGDIHGDHWQVLRQFYLCIKLSQRLPSEMETTAPFGLMFGLEMRPLLTPTRHSSVIVRLRRLRYPRCYAPACN